LELMEEVVTIIEEIVEFMVVVVVDLVWLNW
jgi:hypothetical protein